MPILPIPPPRPTGQVQCRETPPGSGIWHTWEEVEQDYRDYDERGRPIGPVFTELEWLDTEQPCQP